MCYYLADIDIAFNKTAYSSSALDDNTGSFGPQYINNGKADCAHPRGPIAHTKTEQHPWFKIDLEGTFYVKTVVVNPRPSKFIITIPSSKMKNLSIICEIVSSL